MPAKSKKQQKFIYTMRSKYGDEKSTPKDMKWVWEKDWEKIEENIKVYIKERKKCKKKKSINEVSIDKDDVSIIKDLIKDEIAKFLRIIWLKQNVWK